MSSFFFWLGLGLAFIFSSLRVFFRELQFLGYKVKDESDHEVESRETCIEIRDLEKFSSFCSMDA